jgi:hypothetical protein
MVNAAAHHQPAAIAPFLQDYVVRDPCEHHIAFVTLITIIASSLMYP